jgi:DNA-binding transcriptional ArsR family regulator
MPIEEYKNEAAMTDLMVARVVERLRAMADENRVRMLLRLKHGPASVNELASAIGINQPSVSKHLSVLKQVGIVDCQRRGTTASYFIKDETIFDLCALVCQGVRSFANEQHEALGLTTT